MAALWNRAGHYIFVLWFLFSFFFFTGSNARSASRRYLIYSKRPILRFFAPQGQHVALMEVKFGVQEGTKGPLLHA